jgi:hypothetical protein
MRFALCFSVKTTMFENNPHAVKLLKKLEELMVIDCSN